MADQPSGTVTFLFSDVEGSTRLWERYRDAMPTVLATHDGIMRSVIEDNGGYIFSTAGDAFAASFSRAADAITAAVEAQRSLAAEEWGPAEIKVRIGIHTGEAEERGGDYFGQALNRGARLMSAAHGGQVLASSLTARLVSDVLSEQIALVDLGEHRLKDLDAPEQIFQVSDATLLREFPPLRTVAVLHSNLPQPLTSFIGRVQDVAEVCLLVEGNRLVTLTGVGGVGKTRLALEVAGDLADHFVDGVWFVDLSGISDGTLITKQFLVAAGIEERADSPIESTLIERLQGQMSLVVVDNCEHLIDEVAALVEKLLRQVREVTVLATTREALEIPGETVWTVSPLELPEVDAQDAAASEAVELFVERARRFNREFTLTDADLPFCVEICRALDGVPLAIELAAARSGVLSIRQIAERLNDRLTLLARGPRSSRGRQQTLRAAIDWSYDMLEPDQQAMLRRLAVFRAGFSLEAAEALWAEDGAIEPLDLVHQLVDKSLVTVDAGDSGRRFRLLETIRVYARERLDDSGELDTMLDRHKVFFLAWAERQAQLLSTSDQLAALIAMEADHDNLRAVLERSVAAGDLESALRLAANLSFFWWLHSHFGESGAWYERLLAERGRVSAKVQAKVLLGAGEFAMGVCDHVSAAARFEEARQLGRDAGSARIEGWALAYSMTNESYREALDIARGYGEEALEAFGRAGDSLGVGYIDFMQAAIDFGERWATGSLSAGEAEATLRHLEPMLAAARTAGERNLLGHVCELLGSVALEADQLGPAAEYLAEAVRALDTIGNQGCLAHGLDRVAALADQTGRHAEAISLLAGADALRERIGVGARMAEQRFRDLVVASARARLDDEEGRVALDRGSSLDRREAVRLALALTSERDG